ncbi:unnamed protein product, partial [Polarella glacialis]
FFYLTLLIASALFAVLFFKNPGLRKALWDLLSEALGGDDEEEERKGDDSDDEREEKGKRDKKGRKRR